MGVIKILNPGFLTTVQDSGRYGYQKFGVPVSGVMDRFAHRVGNILVGNSESEAVLEITMMGPQIAFNDESIIAITGGDLTPKINGNDISMWESIKVNKGDVLSFAGMKSGCRSYIAFAGGINVPSVMGSKSTYMKGRMGGYQGRKLTKDDEIQVGIGQGAFISKRVPAEYIPKYEIVNRIRVILGPQDDAFTKAGIDTFLNNEYRVTNECDRMGFRLDGEEIEHKQGADIISDGIAFGAIQIPGHGKPIIMMAERQTTGGYTKIGNVISTDLCMVAQSKPGDILKFEAVSIDEAHQVLKDQEQLIAYIKQNCKVNKDNLKEYVIRINGKTYNVGVEEIR